MTMMHSMARQLVHQLLGQMSSFRGGRLSLELERFSRPVMVEAFIRPFLYLSTQQINDAIVCYSGTLQSSQQRSLQHTFSPLVSVSGGQSSYHLSWRMFPEQTRCRGEAEIAVYSSITGYYKVSVAYRLVQRAYFFWRGGEEFREDRFPAL